MGIYFNDLFDESADDYGKFGETIVNNTVKTRIFKDVKCTLFKDLYIEADGWVYQIDHIFIMKSGIFVIETKMIKQKVYGNPKDRYWYYGRNNKFFNPILQNEAHVEALKYIFGDMFDFKSIIVFPNENKPAGCPSNVLNYSEFLTNILKFPSEKELSDEDVAYISGVLNDFQNRKAELKAKHMEQLARRSM